MVIMQPVLVCGFGVTGHGGCLLRHQGRREWKGIGVNFSEEKQGKEDWICGGNIVRFLRCTFLLSPQNLC